MTPTPTTPFTCRDAWHFAVASDYPFASVKPSVLCESRLVGGVAVAQWDALTRRGWKIAAVTDSGDGESSSLTESADKWKRLAAAYDDDGDDELLAASAAITPADMIDGVAKTGRHGAARLAAAVKAEGYADAKPKYKGSQTFERRATGDRLNISFGNDDLASVSLTHSTVKTA